MTRERLGESHQISTAPTDEWGYTTEVEEWKTQEDPALEDTFKNLNLERV